MNDHQYAHQFLEIKPEIKEAIRLNKPVVALESTIITHGMPYPENVQTAVAVEQIIRKNGAVPATIAILDGRIKVGLSGEEIERLANLKHVVKASRRDLPVIVAKKLHGATTVAGTMIIAKMSGISIFVTGGIGGVHRDANITMDISADLRELSQTDVAVVCAGAKSILDIGLTLEYLETQGVPVLGFKTDRFPAFYTRDSGFPVDERIDSPAEAAKILHDKWKMGLNGGVVIANPIPSQYALNEQEIDQTINIALQEMKEKNITGKAVTPFLLAKLEEMTSGKSLDSNIALVKHNAAIGAEIAVHYVKMKEETDGIECT